MFARAASNKQETNKARIGLAWRAGCVGASSPPHSVSHGQNENSACQSASERIMGQLVARIRTSGPGKLSAPFLVRRPHIFSPLFVLPPPTFFFCGFSNDGGYRLGACSLETEKRRQAKDFFLHARVGAVCSHLLAPSHSKTRNLMVLEFCKVLRNLRRGRAVDSVHRSHKLALRLGL